MSKFYGTVKGSAQTVATRSGHDNIRVSAQSWDGSVVVELAYRADGSLLVGIETPEGSASSGRLCWSGTFEQFKEQLRK